jgi:hypothetical protein
MDLTPLKLALIFFWALWFSIVFLTNVFSAMKAAGRLPPSWRFASKNYEMVVKAVSIYGPPPWLPRLLFLGVITWQLGAGTLFWYALADMTVANAAFCAGILLFAAFMIADELTLKYAMEQPHELLFIAQVASLLVVHLL